MSNSTRDPKLRYTREQLIECKAKVQQHIERYLVPLPMIRISKSRRRIQSLRTTGQLDGNEAEAHPVTHEGDEEWETKLFRRARQVATRHPYQPHKTSAEDGEPWHPQPWQLGNVTARGDVVGTDWTRGCGNWRHRSKSGSERGAKFFHPRGARGRGRGEFDDQSMVYYNRGGRPMRRPFNAHSGRGWNASNSRPGIRRDSETTQDQDAIEDCWQDDDVASAQLLGLQTDVVDDVLSIIDKLQLTDNDLKIDSPPGLTVTSKARSSAKPIAAPQSKKPDSSTTLWYYKDTAGDAHGPFENEKMAKWFSAGDFAINMPIRRECDSRFSQLVEYMNLMGRFPFVDSDKLPPIVDCKSCPSADDATPASDPTPLLPTRAQPPYATSATVTPVANKPPGNESTTHDLPSTPVTSITQEVKASNNSSQMMAEASPETIQSRTQTALDELRLIEEKARELRERASAFGIDASLLPTVLHALSPDSVPLVAAATDTPLDPIQNGNAVQPVPRPRKAPTQAQSLPKTSGPTKTLPKTSEPIQRPIKTPVSASSSSVGTPAAAPPPSAHILPSKPAAPSPTLSTASLAVALTVPEAAPTKKSKRSKRKSKTAQNTDEVIDASVAHTPEFDPLSPEPSSSLSPSPIETQHAFTFPSPAPMAVAIMKPKKKRSKPTAEDVRQKAWEQEEERRKQQHAERLAQEAATAAEEEAYERALFEEQQQAAEAKKLAASESEARAAARQRELMRRQLAAAQTNKSPPSPSCWTQAATASAVSTTGNITRMADILASEQELLASTGPLPKLTLADRLANQASTIPPKGTQKQARQAQQPKITAVSAAVASSAVAATSNTSSEKVKKASTTNAQTKNAGSQKATAPTKAQAASTVSIWDLPTEPIAPTSKKSKKKKAGGSGASVPLTPNRPSLSPSAMRELTDWCEAQLCAFHRTDVHLPTLVNLLCDFESFDDVLNCVEISFGKSVVISKFSKAFIQKRDVLMSSTA